MRMYVASTTPTEATIVRQGTSLHGAHGRVRPPPDVGRRTAEDQPTFGPGRPGLVGHGVLASTSHRGGAIETVWSVPRTGSRWAMFGPRSLSRALLAAPFIVGGINALRAPAKMAPAAEEVGVPIAEQVGLPDRSRRRWSRSTPACRSAPARCSCSASSPGSPRSPWPPRWCRRRSPVTASGRPRATSGSSRCSTSPRTRRCSAASLAVALDTGGRPSVFWQGRRAAGHASETLGDARPDRRRRACSSAIAACSPASASSHADARVGLLTPARTTRRTASQAMTVQAAWESVRRSSVDRSSPATSRSTTIGSHVVGVAPGAPVGGSPSPASSTCRSTASPASTSRQPTRPAGPRRCWRWPAPASPPHCRRCRQPRPIATCRRWPPPQRWCARPTGEARGCSASTSRARSCHRCAAARTARTGCGRPTARARRRSGSPPRRSR